MPGLTGQHTWTWELRWTWGPPVSPTSYFFPSSSSSRFYLRSDGLPPPPTKSAAGALPAAGHGFLHGPATAVGNELDQMGGVGPEIQVPHTQQPHRPLLPPMHDDGTRRCFTTFERGSRGARPRRDNEKEKINKEKETVGNTNVQDPHGVAPWPELPSSVSISCPSRPAPFSSLHGRARQLAAELCPPFRGWRPGRRTPPLALAHAHRRAHRSTALR